MIGGKKFGGLLFLVGITVFFGLSSTGCEKKSSQTGKTGGETIGTGGIGGGKEECPVWYKDADGDGYTDGTTQVSCKQPTGYVSQAQTGDCDDGDSNINPGRAEICDSKDNNCNGQIDEGVLLVFYKDADGDGYTDGTTQVSCKQPTGYVSQAQTGDCDDGDSSINPGRAEICDSKDNNCNGQIDEEDVCVFVSAKVEAGGHHTCAIKTNGSLWCWGYNYYGQLGIGTWLDKKVPTQVSGTNWVTVSAGVAHTCGVKTDGTLWCCGYNEYGQLGIGTWLDKNAPTQVGTGTNWVSVSAGKDHTCGVKTDGTLWCWGRNNYGQLGDGTTGNKNVPVQVSGTNWVSVSAGDGHTCGIKTDGTLWCWGDNLVGQLGDGTNTNKNTPVYIMSLGSGGGGGAPSIFFGDKSSFDNREEKQANIGQKQTIYGCSSVNVTFYIIYLIFPAFILFALRKVRD
jgi:hypothetical protein